MTEVRPKASGHSEVYTFALLFEAAHHALNQAKVTPEHRVHFCLHSLVASAFCLEAYLNHVGERQLKLWSPPERKSPRTKLNLVCGKLKVKPQFEARPFSSFTWVMAFRNSVAHGRTEVVTFEDAPVDDEHGMPERPLSTIEQACSLDVASAVFQDVRGIVESLGKRTGSRLSPLLIASHTQWTST